MRETVVMPWLISLLTSEPRSETEEPREKSRSLQPLVLFVIVSLYLADAAFSRDLRLSEKDCSSDDGPARSSSRLPAPPELLPLPRIRVSQNPDRSLQS